MNELAVKAANGTNQSEDQSYIQSEVDALINEIDRVSQTTTFNERNLLDGSWSAGVNLQVGTEGTSGNRIAVSINAMSAGGIGISSLSSSGVASESAAQNSISVIKAAISSVSKQRSDLGAIQNRLEHTINNLDNVAENTTSAESAIRDTDMATEMVKYSNNNILAQAGQAMLAQANQSNQGVLSLLG
jgi:flagellin